MHVMSALIGVHGLQVLRVTHDVVANLDAVTAVHVAGLTGDVERLTAIVSLDDGDHLGSHLTLVHQTADTQAALKSE